MASINHSLSKRTVSALHLVTHELLREAMPAPNKQKHSLYKADPDESNILNSAMANCDIGEAYLPADAWTGDASKVSLRALHVAMGGP